MTKAGDNRIRRLYTMDNLPVLRCIDSETTDLIYFDLPFNPGKQWENPAGKRNKRVPASFRTLGHYPTLTPMKGHCLQQIVRGLRNVINIKIES